MAYLQEQKYQLTLQMSVKKMTLQPSLEFIWKIIQIQEIIQILVLQKNPIYIKQYQLMEAFTRWFPQRSWRKTSSPGIPLFLDTQTATPTTTGKDFQFMKQNYRTGQYAPYTRTWIISRLFTHLGDIPTAGIWKSFRGTRLP